MDAMHHDEEKYADPFKFDPNRFVVSPESAGAAEKNGRRQQLAMTGADYLTWGLGKHAWYVFHPDVFVLLTAFSSSVLGDGLRRPNSKRCLPILL
jgi:hypothetical protein